MAIFKSKSASVRSGARLEKMKKQMEISSGAKQVHLEIGAELLKRFKSKTASEGVTMTSVIVKAIREYLK